MTGTRSRIRRLARAVAWSLTATTVAVLAASPAQAKTDPSTARLNTIIGNATGWLVGISAAVATLFLTVGGIRYVMAGGDPAEVEKAKAAFKSAGLGYALAALAPLAVGILKSILGVR